jgi:hypothetical protein
MTGHESIEAANPELPRDLAAALRGVSAWQGGPTSLHAAALASERARRRPVLARIPRPWLYAAAALLLIGIPMLLLPSLGRARYSSAQRVAVDSSPRYRLPAASDGPAAVGGKVDEQLSGASPPAEPMESAVYSSSDGEAHRSASKPAPVDEGRQVVRKVNIELKARDVRGTFLKASQLVSETGGEFIEQSSMTGSESSLYGALTLRVAATRLSVVLNQLRGLADVVQETAAGEDVTDQAVDLDARLRNEQRVETELLGLLESRKDAPLKEILELRESISSVRGQIERLTAQRDRLSRLVSLATVLVIIRGDAVHPGASAEEGIWAYFTKELARAWRTALEFLAESVAFLVRVFIGGAVFWVIGGLLLMLAVTASRRLARRRAQEAAPRL